MISYGARLIFKKIVPFFVANWMVYSLNALFYSFIPIYLVKYHSQSKVGLLLSIGPLVSIFAPIFWGSKADKSKSKNNVLMLIIFASAIFFYAISFNSSIIWLVPVFTVLMFFMSPFGGLIDTITMEYAYENNLSYGFIRLMGTLGFGIMSLGIGFLVSYSLNSIFYIFLVSSAVTIITIKIMPVVKGHFISENKKKLSFIPLLMNKNIVLLLIFVGVAQFTFGYYLNFFSIYFTQTLNYPKWIWGLNILFQVLGEVPFFIFFDKIIKRFGVQKLIVTATAFTVFRCVILVFITNIPAILVTSLFTGVLPTIAMYCAAYYINKVASPEYKASGQTLIYSLSVGIPRILSGVIGGIISEKLGIPNSMLICSVISIVALISTLVFPIREESHNQDVKS